MKIFFLFFILKKRNLNLFIANLVCCAPFSVINQRPVNCQTIIFRIYFILWQCFMAPIKYSRDFCTNFGANSNPKVNEHSLAEIKVYIVIVCLRHGEIHLLLTKAEIKHCPKKVNIIKCACWTTNTNELKKKFMDESSILLLI